MSGSPEPLWGSSTVETASVPFSGCTAGRFNQYSTLQEHMPPEHQKYVQWNGERFIHWIGKVSSNTQVAVQAILGSYKVEQQGYKSCVDLSAEADKQVHPGTAGKCLQTGIGIHAPPFSQKNIPAILASGQDKGIHAQVEGAARHLTPTIFNTDRPMVHRQHRGRIRVLHKSLHRPYSLPSSVGLTRSRSPKSGCHGFVGPWVLLRRFYGGFSRL